MFSRKYKESEETDVVTGQQAQRVQTSAVNGVVVDVNELSAAVATINRYKEAFGHHMQFREVGGRLKVQIAIGAAETK